MIQRESPHKDGFLCLVKRFYYPFAISNRLSIRCGLSLI
jgi:hypothetical protein